MSIPLVDLAEQHRRIADEVLAGMAAVLERTAFVQGPDVTAFEHEFAAFSGVPHCVGVANGTDALEIAMRVVGVTPGDEVVVPANTFIATAEAALRIGARIVPVDVDPQTLLMDPDRLASVVGPRTRAIVPVHLYGQLAPMERIAQIAADAGVAVVEDAAQAQGATRHGRGIGAWGALAATSFYPGKNLGAYGDAGAVLTRDGDHAAAARAMGSHGSTIRYQHPVFGFNSRMDTLQAVVLRAKLARLASWNLERQEAAARYDALLADAEGVTRPVRAEGNEHVWHLYVIQVDDRDATLRRLNEEGIGAAIHYPVPVHLQGVLADHGYRPGAFPITEAAADRILSLPLYPGITAEQQERVTKVLLS